MPPRGKILPWRGRSPVISKALTRQVRPTGPLSSPNSGPPAAFTVTDYAALVFSLPHCLGDRHVMPDDWWQRQLARDWVNVGKSHDPATWFDVLDNDPEGNEPGPDCAAAGRINGSFDILRRGDITP